MLFPASLSINAIYDEVIKTDNGLGMDFERIRAALEQLGCQDSPTDIEENYSVGTHTLSLIYISTSVIFYLSIRAFTM